MSEESARFRFPRARRVQSTLDFNRIYALKQKAGNRLLLIFAAKNELEITRIGLSVSRKNGNSVVRHRLRRLLREAYRLEQHAIPEGLDLILIPRPEAPGSLAEYREAMVKLCRRLTETNLQ